MGCSVRGGALSQEHLDNWSRLARDVDFGASLQDGSRLVMVLPETDRAGASVVAERFRRAFGSELAEMSGQESLAGLGVVSYPHHGSTSEALLSSAEDLIKDSTEQISVGSFTKIAQGDRF